MPEASRDRSLGTLAQKYIMIDDLVRYVDRTTSGALSVEVCFSGASSERLGSENPEETDVEVRILRKSNIHLDSSPWIVVVARPEGNIKMPSGSWNGIKLTEIFEDRVFVAISSKLSEIDVATGEIIWSLETGNTPIYWIMASRNGDGLIVFNGYYRFRHPLGFANIAFVSFSGVEEWRSPLPSGDDIFANHPYYDGKLLKSSSWNGITYTIDHASGDILDRHFTK